MMILYLYKMTHSFQLIKSLFLSDHLSLFILIGLQSLLPTREIEIIGLLTVKKRSRKYLKYRVCLFFPVNKFITTLWTFRLIRLIVLVFVMINISSVHYENSIHVLIPLPIGLNLKLTLNLNL